MSYRVIAHSRSGEVSYRGTEVHASYGAAEREARTVALRAGLTDVHVVKDGKRIVGEVKARSNPNRFTSVDALHRAVMGAIRRAGERYLDDSTVAMKDGGFFSCRPAHLKKFTTALARFGIVYRTKMIGASAVVFYDAKDNVAGYRRAGIRGGRRRAARWVGQRRRRNPAPSVCGWGLCTKKAVDGYRCREHRGLYRPDETRGGTIRCAPRPDLDRHGFVSMQKKRRNPSWDDYKDFVELARFEARHEPASDLRVGDRVLFGSPLRWGEVTSLSRDGGKISIEARDLLNGQLRSGHSSPDGLVYMWRNHKSPSRSSAHRRNPDIEALSWPPAWGTAGKSKKDFKACVAKHGMDAEVMCHGMRSVPGSLRDLPRAKYVVYGGTSNPNVTPAKWYATLDLTGATPKVS